MPPQSIGFVSFAGGDLRWKLARIRLDRQIRSSRYFNSIRIYSTRKLHKLIDPHMAEFILANRLGYGLWIWKPIVILDFLERNPKSSSILYLDAGCDFNPSNSSKAKWDEYLSYLQNFEAIVFQTTHKEESYTSKQLVKELDIEPINVISGQIQAGSFFMTRNFAEDFCRKWLNVMTCDDFFFLKNEKNSNDFEPYDSYIDYRYDQSVFSLMMKKCENIKILQVDQETEFAPDWKSGRKHPILTSRNRSIVPVLKTRLIHRGLRRIERRVVKTYGLIHERRRNRNVR